MRSTRRPSPIDPPHQLDYERFGALTFDCYGTLIDWETGIREAISPVLARHAVELDGERLLELYGRHEAEVEAGPYRSYAAVLRETLGRIGEELAFAPSEAELAAFSRSVGDWPPFPDSAAALARLGQTFRLGVISNCDDALLAQSLNRLGTSFDLAVTAEQARAYKPSQAPFELALARVGLPPAKVLHVAQSRFHDHVPAQSLGIRTVWVDRRHGREGHGATPPAEARPDLVVADLRSLAELATAR